MEPMKSSRKSSNFLPDYFKSSDNKKFLNATLDQLISEPKLKKLNGYIGRAFSASYSYNNNYIIEDTPERNYYQLEPAVVIKTGNSVDRVITYTDVINKIKFYGGNPESFSNLFSGDTYNYDGHFDFDKITNFGNYFWLPNGPDVIDAGLGFVESERDFYLDFNWAFNSYEIDNEGYSNPTIYLIRGGKYNFISDENIFITKDTASIPSIERDKIYGIEENGKKIIEFNVPTGFEQDYIKEMPTAFEVDFAIDSTLSDISNKFLADIDKSVFDGVISDVDFKYFIFVNQQESGNSWNSDYVRDRDGNIVDGYENSSFSASNDDKISVWQIRLIDVNGEQVVTVIPNNKIQQFNKVFVKSGVKYSSESFYNDGAKTTFQRVDSVTADLDTLYFNIPSKSDSFGTIRIINQFTYTFSVSEDIIGKSEYITQNRIKFSNGMKIKFDSSPKENEYKNNVFYVEGVGTKINLVPVSDLMPVEVWKNSEIVDRGENYSIGDIIEVIGGEKEIPSKTLIRVNLVDEIGGILDFSLIQSATYKILPTNPVEVEYDGAGIGARFEVVLQKKSPDYITIKRDSVDYNSWTRSNRWFHEDIIKESAKYNGLPPILDQTLRAKRPIIEFDSNIQLFNSGKYFSQYVSIADFSYQDALSDFHGSSDVFDMNSAIVTGSTIVFMGDSDPDVRNKVYRIFVETIEETEKFFLQEVKEINDEECIVVLSGNNIHKTFYYKNSHWYESQIQSELHEIPTFDVVDKTQTSFGDTTVYPFSSFNGTKIFSYKSGNTYDDVLGFRISYRNIDNIGDIEFANSYEIDTFEYSNGSGIITEQVSSGYLVKYTKDSIELVNVWKSLSKKPEQYQQYSSILKSGQSQFVIPSALKNDDIVVFLNSIIVPKSKFIVEKSENWTRITIYSTTISDGDRLDVFFNPVVADSNVFFDIPVSLQNNPLNQMLSGFTMGQMRNHVKKILSQSKSLIGIDFGANNSRDFYYKDNIGEILQHSSPAIYSFLFLVDERLKFVESVQNASREYLRFKNRFLEKAKKYDQSSFNSVAEAVDSILVEITLGKGPDSPWFYSDMVPYGNNRVEFEYEVLNVDIRKYKIDEIYDLRTLSNKSVLVYLNGDQLLNSRDYIFSETTPSIELLPSVPLSLSDRIKIVAYNTDANFIPETPTKLGLYPSFEPMIELDDTYTVPLMVIVGHDGSITPAFGDHRDQYLLELERRIFNNIKTQFDFGKNSVLLNSLQGKFRENSSETNYLDYLLSGSFLKWVGQHQLSFSENSTFSGNSPRTWNHRNSQVTLDNSAVNGNWRSIYQKYFDTDKPHTKPWRMLGFSIKPSWWEKYYGPAPYTGGNKILWNDLENGIIRDGHRKGTDIRFKREGLHRIIPVDDFGNLKMPNDFMIKSSSYNTMSSSWAVGDCGPVETAWKNSSDYPYAMQIALCLIKPGEYFSLLVDTSRYSQNNITGQFAQKDTNKKLSPENIVINGYTKNGSVLRASGWTNWVVDNLTAQGISGADYVENIIKNTNVQLCYRVGGFTDKSLMNVYADQTSPTSFNESVLVPKENYNFVLHKSAPKQRVVYSAVIVRKTATGYAVEGYDYKNPFFLIIPSRSNNNYYTIKSGSKSAKIYKDYQKTVLSVPYGYEFKTRQQVVDFIVSYERHLLSAGFLFDEYDQDLRQRKDWVLSAREFMTWSNQGWKNDSMIVLSPSSEKIVLETGSYTADEITGKWNESKILDLNFNAITPEKYSIYRDDGIVEIETINQQTIALADIALVQHEHVLVMDNETVFSDVIYQPTVGSRQLRLKLIGKKTGEWYGNINPPGFMYYNGDIPEWSDKKDYFRGDVVKWKEKIYSAIEFVPASLEFNFDKWKFNDNVVVEKMLLRNFASNAEKFTDIYNVDGNFYEQDLEKFSSSLIGFRTRSYLNDFGVDGQTQLKFYQGFIKEKGTKSAIDSLTKTKFNKLTGDIDFNEEWAIRVGEFGFQSNKDSIELIVEDSLKDTNPIVFNIVESESDKENYGRNILLSELYSSTKNTKDIFSTKPSYFTDNNILTSGFVHDDDVDLSVLSFQDSFDYINEKLGDIGDGYYISVAKSKNNKWDVFRITSSNMILSSVEYGLDNTAIFTTNIFHNFKNGEYFIVKNFDPNVDGLYQVLESAGLKSVVVTVSPELNSYLEESESVDGDGYILRFVSVKYTNTDEYDNEMRWKNGDKFWIENDQSCGVIEKDEPYILKTSFPSTIYGTPTKIVHTDSHVFISYKDYNGGVVFAVDTETNSRHVINCPLTGCVGFGRDIYVKNGYLYVGIEDSDTYGGIVCVFDTEDEYSVLQYIFSGNVELFGSSIAYNSLTDQVLISSPIERKVYTFKYFDTEYKEQFLSTTSGINTYLLPLFPESNDSVRVIRDDGVSLLPMYDYVIDNQEITFLGDPETRTYLIKEYGYFTNTSTISVPENYSDVSFGETIVCPDDNPQVFVSAPSATIDEHACGTVYIFDQVIESFLYNGQPIVTNRNLSATPSGKITNTIIANGIVLNQSQDYTVSDGNITIISEKVKTWDTVSVFMNEWTMTQRVVPPYLQDGMRFGHSISSCDSGCNIVVSAPNYTTIEYQRGIVFKYNNVSRIVGEITSTTLGVLIDPEESLIINGFEVFSNGTSINDLSESINLSNIAGISSIVENGYLKIISDSLIVNKTLSVSNGYGSMINKLGIEPFVVTQELKKPTEKGFEYFGTNVVVSGDGTKMFVSSKSPYVQIGQKWDNSITLWDNNSTEWKEIIEYSGTIYAYEVINKKSDFLQNLYTIQEILPNSLGSRNNYAKNIYYYNNILSVTSDNTAVEFFLFDSFGKNGFTQIRTTTEVADQSMIDSIMLYDKRKNTIVAFLDTINYADSKILGIANQHIDYKSEIDPAWYNNTESYGSYAWYEKNVGKIWWDLSTVRFKDSNQGDLKYRVSKNTEKVFGSSVDVYEWVESDYLPSQYIQKNGDGVPYDVTDKKYSSREYIDPTTLKVKYKYYYWVKNKIKDNNGKNITTSYVTNVIENPTVQNIPYAEIYDSNSFGIYNCNQFLNDKNIVLRITTKQQVSDKVLHHEWHLLKDSGNETIPKEIITKTIDSLVGYDRFGREVPDTSLIGENRLGISVRPRQTMFANRKSAVKTVIESLNSKFKNIQIVNSVSLDSLLAMQKKPENSEYDLEFSTIDQALTNDFSFQEDGTRILIHSDKNYNGNWSVYILNDSEMIFDYKQEFNLSNYWSYENWNSVEYDEKLIVRRTVGSMDKLVQESLSEGEIVKINDVGDGRWGIYKKQNDRLVPMSLQNATIKISDIFYTIDDGENYPYLELRLLLEALNEKILTNQLKYIFVDVIMLLFKYVFVEQKEPDWIMKTSFASVLHRIRKLDPYPIYVRDNQDYYLSFINEVKPYKTKIRQYLLSYNGEETSTLNCTDFDKPVYYDQKTKNYRVLDRNDQTDRTILQTYPWKDWYDNSTLSIKTVDVLSSDFYSYEPTIIVRNGDGTARLRAILGEDARIKEVVVINGGKGFDGEADIYVSGNSTITKLRANLYHKNVRTISTKIKFDRTDYYGEFKSWMPNTLYKVGQYFSINQKVYVVVLEHTSAIEFQENENVSEIKIDSYPSAMHRAKMFYNSSNGSKNKNLKEIFSGLDYSGVKVKGTLFSDPDIQFYDFERYGKPDENISKIDSYIKNIRFIDTNYGLSPEDITVSGGKFYDKFSGYGPEELVAGAIFDTMDIRIFTKIQSGENQGKHYGYRIFHDMNQNLPHHNRDAEPTVQLREDFGKNDTQIKVKLHDEYAIMGTYELNGNVVPQEIMINGEKISYTVYDRANNILSGIQRNTDGRLESIEGIVHKKDSFVTVLNNMRKSRKYYRISDENTGKLVQNLNLSDNDIYVDDAAKFIKPSAPDNRHGVIYVNGEKIKYFRINYETNTLSQLTRGVDGTSIKEVHLKDSVVTDMSERHEIDGGDETVWIDFDKDTAGQTLSLFELSEKFQAVFVKGAVCDPSF